MSLPEIAWRMRHKLRAPVDRALLGRRSRPMRPGRILRAQAGGAGRVEQTLQVRAGALGEHLREVDSDSAGYRSAWRSAVVEAADAVRAHRLSFFDCADVHLGDPVRWNYEHKAGKATPMTFAPSIDYRDYEVTGDCKHVWEPNRHHHFVTLGRAYRATGDAAYAEALAEQLESWIEQCPYGRGMNWRSPLELGIRLINWVWALELIRPSGVISGDRIARLMPVVYRHLWELARNYSRYSSANNHLIGEAAGVYIAGRYFVGIKDADRWAEAAREILSREILEQTYEDGGTREQAFGYHVFVLQFFLLCGLVARHCDDALPETYWRRLEKMFEFTAAFVEGGAPVMFGDSDDGYVLDLGGSPRDARAFLAVGAVLFDRPDFKALAGECSEAVFWLLGADGCARFDGMNSAAVSRRLRSRELPQAGYYLLQCGQRGDASGVSVVFDCGELGFKSIAAHGHADALSVTLRVGGTDVLVDPGTYDYFTYPQWRRHFRSTRAHNTVAVDGADQSELLGSFLWGRRARATLLEWRPTDAGGTVAGEHDGYARLADPVTHRRRVTLAGDEGALSIEDELHTGGAHEVTQYWHVAPGCRVERDTDDVQSRVVRVAFDGGGVRIAFDPRVDVEIRAADASGLGWFSGGYHCKQPSHVVICRAQAQGRLALRTRMHVLAAGAACGGKAGVGTGGLELGSV